MQRLTVQAIIAVVLSGCLAISQAGPAAIGVAVANGSFQVNNQKVSGNATLFEGTQVQTGAAASELRLNSGARMSLDAGAAGRVFRDHMVLEKGAGRFDAAQGYAVRARSLSILPEGAGSKGYVQLAGSNRVQVSALAGGIRVTNAQGVLVARLSPGAAMEFEPQAAGAATPSRLSGCLQKKGGRYLLTDETTHVTVELTGGALAAEAGNRVEIVGTLDPTAKPASASQLIRVTEVKRLSKGCSDKAAAATAGAAAGAAAGAGAAGAGAGIGVGTTVAIVGGVAAAATVGGLAVAEKLPGQGDDSKPSASR